MPSGEMSGSVLCAASSYIQKFYLGPEYANLPKEVQEQLKIIAVEFTEDVGGIFLMVYDRDGHLGLQSRADDGDYLYDEIGADLKLRSLRTQYRDLFEKLELYYTAMQSLRKS